MSATTRQLATKLEALLSSMGRAPRFHGNGFVQLYLTEHKRLHVWDGRLSRIPGHNAAVHDHVYSMRSTVLLGILNQVTYELPARGYRAHEDDIVDIFRLSPESRRDPRGEPDFEHISRGYMRQTGHLAIAEGSTYSQARDTLHDSEPESELVATLFERLPQEDDERNARVVCPAGERPMNAFAPEHQPAQDALWSAIGGAVQRMPRWALKSLMETISE